MKIRRRKPLRITGLPGGQSEKEPTEIAIVCEITKTGHIPHAKIKRFEDTLEALAKELFPSASIRGLWVHRGLEDHEK